MLRVADISLIGVSRHTPAALGTFVRLTWLPKWCWCDSDTFFGGEHFQSTRRWPRSERWVAGVEVTGGEPLAQKEAFQLIRTLCDEGLEVLIETGGYVSIEDIDERASVILDVKCPASGEETRNHWPNLERLRADKDEVKFVVADRGDWDFTRDVIERHSLQTRASAILISPVWGQIDLKELAEWIAGSGLNVRMQLQLHKYIWGPEVQGV